MNAHFLLLSFEKYLQKYHQKEMYPLPIRYRSHQRSRNFIILTLESQKSQQRKRNMQLNGWQRIGVVVSIIWGIGAAIYERKSQVDSVNDIWLARLSECLPVFSDGCFDLKSKQYAELLALNSSNVSDVLYLSLGPILVGWLTAYLATKIFIWVKAGFQSNV
jgi:hypothetical protein